MAVAVTMPKLGLTMSSGNIAQWRKKEGDWVAKGEILFVVATDKLTFDVEAQETGIFDVGADDRFKEKIIGVRIARYFHSGSFLV